jgi:c-di-GMP-binding flagellar brake protein YcgR
MPHKHLHLIFLFFLSVVTCASGAVEGQSYIHYLNWKGPPPFVTALFLMTLVTSSGLIFLFHIRSKDKLNTDSKLLSERLFNENAIRVDLTASETRKLKELLRHEIVSNPHIIFQSVVLFERCVQAEVDSLLASNIDEERVGIEESLLSSLRKKLGYVYLPLETPLISTRGIETGQKISIFGQNHASPLISKAVVVMNKQFFFRIQYDPDKEEVNRFKVESDLKIAFARKCDGVYGIPVKIYKISSQSTLDLLHTSEMKRNQLRHYVRIDVNLPLKIRILKTESEDKSSSAGTVVETKMADISGGGLSFLSEKPLLPGDLISLNFQIPGLYMAGIAGKVLRVSLQEGKAGTLYRHHVQFTNIEQKYRDGIVKYVFEKQRQQNQLR